jgi:hypothetical protein
MLEGSLSLYEPSVDSNDLNRRGPGCLLLLSWLIATTVSAILGQAIGQVLVGALTGGNTDLLTVATMGVPAGALMGLVLGGGQGLVLLRFIGLPGFRQWVAANAIGGVVRWAVIGPISQMLFVNIRLFLPPCGAWIVILVYGVLIGAAFGIPQAIVLERHLGHAADGDNAVWVLANGAGGILGIPIVSLTGLTGAAILAMLGPVEPGRGWQAITATAIIWAIVGIATSFPLLDRVRYGASIVRST